MCPFEAIFGRGSSISSSARRSRFNENPNVALKSLSFEELRSSKQKRAELRGCPLKLPGVGSHFRVRAVNNRLTRPLRNPAVGPDRHSSTEISSNQLLLSAYLMLDLEVWN